MMLFDPVSGVGDKEFAHRRAIRSVEIDRLAPFIGMAVGEISRREGRQIIPVRPEMVVDDVDNDREADRMSAVDKAAQVVGPAVEPRRREQIDAVVAPAEAAGEIGDRHHFDAGDAEMFDFGKVFHRGSPCSFRSKLCNMSFVEDNVLRFESAPLFVGPLEGAGSMTWRTVWPFRLKARGGIRKHSRIEAELIEEPPARTELSRPEK